MIRKLVRLPVNKLCLRLRVCKLLSAVETIISRQRKADGDCHREVRHRLKAKKLESQEHGRDRAVCDADEGSQHSRCRAEDGSKPVSSPKVHPKEDPTASVGTISPPLNPPPRATAVKTIFSKNPRYADSPSTAFSTRLNPAPQ